MKFIQPHVPAVLWFSLFPRFPIHPDLNEQFTLSPEGFPSACHLAVQSQMVDRYMVAIRLSAVHEDGWHVVCISEDCHVPHVPGHSLMPLNNCIATSTTCFLCWYWRAIIDSSLNKKSQWLLVLMKI